MEKKLSVVVMVLFFLVSGSCFAAYTSPSDPCRKMGDKGKLVAAAQCLEALELKGRAKRLIKLQKLIRGLWLRNASAYYRQAAKKAKSAAEKVFLLEKAMLVITLVRKRYCLRAYRCRQADGYIAKLRSMIGYSTLTVLANKGVQITVSGYEYRKSTSGVFSHPVRPGQYTIVAGKKRKSVQLTPHKTVIVDMKARQVRVIIKKIAVPKKMPAVVIAGYASGGALIAGGLVMGIYGVARQASLNNTRRDPVSNQQQTDSSYDKEFETARWVGVIGWIVAGGGVAVIGGTVAAHFLSGRKRNLAPPPPKKLSFVVLDTR